MQANRSADIARITLQLLALGVIGLFIGPVVLAVAYTLLVDWVSQGTPSDEQGPPTAALHEVKE